MPGISLSLNVTTTFFKFKNDGHFGGQKEANWSKNGNLFQIFFFNITFLKFIISKKASKIDEIFTVDLTLCGKC